MTVARERLTFPAGDSFAHRTAKEVWRRETAAATLPSAARRIAAVLPDYLSLSHGYCWPRNEDLMAAINSKKATVENGIAALDRAGLIERWAETRRDEKGEAIGKNRRIWLTRPVVNPTVLSEVNPTVEVNPTPEKVNPIVNPTPGGEPYTGVGNKRDSDSLAYEDKAETHACTHAHAQVSAPAHAYVRTHASARVSEIPSFPDRLAAGRWLGDFLFPGDEIFDQCVDAALAGTLTLDTLASAQAVCYPDASAL